MTALREAAHEPDQLIVDVTHLPVVHAELMRLGVRRRADEPTDEPTDEPAGRTSDTPFVVDLDLESIEQDEALGLARLTGLVDADGDQLDVDDLVVELRHTFAAQRGGFVPTIGKNRFVDGVIGCPRGTKPFAGEEPRRLEPGEQPPVVPAPGEAGTGVRLGIIDTPLPSDPLGSTDHRMGHGLFVRGLVLQQAPRAEVVFEGALSGPRGRANSWDVAKAIVALAPRVDILNLSLGCYSPPDGAPLVMSRAIERVATQVLVVAAAGNHGMSEDLANARHRTAAIWPGALPPVVAVGAVDGDGARPMWSPDLTWISCAALGVDVVSTYVHGTVELQSGPETFDGFARWSGTSFAAATVSGAIAARTVPGQVTPHEALAQLLAEQALVKPFALGR